MKKHDIFSDIGKIKIKLNLIQNYLLERNFVKSNQQIEKAISILIKLKNKVNINEL